MQLCVGADGTELKVTSGRVPDALRDRCAFTLLKEQNMLVDQVSRTRYISSMKTATIPPVRIEPAFRQQIEASLGDGETMAALVENAVRTEVVRRRDQSEFVRRGLAAVARSEAVGDWIPAELVIAKLEAKVVAARERQKHKHS